MSNLIITIIGIVLLAVLAIGGIMYVSTTMNNGQANAWASAMISQNQQLFAAANNWSVDHGGADFGSVPQVLAPYIVNIISLHGQTTSC